ncbi:hypothetical protein KJA13_04325 [Patescibacteria group bacterium]|nr:hypothetical protein [Patescibacteria group bacterium]
MLVRKHPPSDEEWLDLIEARRSLIKPHLDSFTLPKLGELKCLRTESWTEGHDLYDALTIRDTLTVTGDTRFSLKTQGIFRRPWSGIQRIPNSGYRAPGGGCPDGTMYIWGLTRAGQWILAKVEFKGEPGYKKRGYERATRVHIEESDLATIIAKTKSTSEEIWRELGKAIKDWTKARHQLYRRAREIARIIRIEELALSLCQGEE